MLFFFSALNVTWKQLYSRFTFYAHLCQMFKSINKIGGYIKVSRYTKIHLALKKFQPPWTHKAIQAWMHPFWLKKISSVLCWGTGTGCAKPIFDTQIISNRKYSNPLFPLTMLWFWETETQWWKEQVCGRQHKWVTDFRQRCCLWTLIAGEHLWTEVTVKTQSSQRRVLGGDVFPLPQGLVQSLLKWTERFLLAQGLFELSSSKVLAMNESPRADGQSLL